MRGFVCHLKIRWGWLVFTSSLFLLELWSCYIFLSDFYAYETRNFFLRRIAFYLFPMIASVVCSQFRPRIAHKRSTGMRIAFAAFSIMLTTVAFQSLCWNNLWNVSEISMRSECVPLNLSLVVVLFSVIWAFVWDSRRSALILYWIMFVLGVAYRFVYEVRGSVFKIADLLTMQTGLNVLGHYSYHLRSEHVFWGGCGICLWVLSQWVPKQKSHTTRMKLGKVSFVAMTGAWILILLYSPLMNVMGITTTVWHGDIKTWDCRQGVLVTLMKQTQEIAGIRPKTYTTASVHGIDNRLMQPGINKTKHDNPNVIVVMNEALTDLQELWEFEVNQDALPYLRSLRKQTVWGNLFVSSFGGATCNTEHSFLTGTAPVPNLPMPLLATVKEKTPSLAWYLKSMGYQTYAIHPANRINYQRDVFYPRLGFDSFYSIEEFEKASTLRSFVSDESCYDKIISLFEGKGKDERIFIFNVTMQNHSPYYAGDLEEKIIINNNATTPEMQTYLNSIFFTDKAFEKLITYFGTYQEPTVILMFGDHQPSVETNVLNMQETLSDTEERFIHYITPFIIWANYPIDSRKVEGISVNYLSALLLNTAGLPMTKYDEWILEIAEKYPVVNLYGYGDANGQSSLWDKDEKNWPLELQQLNLLRYNRLYDEENRLPALGIP